MRSFERGKVLLEADTHRILAMRMRFDPRGLHAEDKLDSFARQHLLHGFGEVGILAREHALAAHQHRHPAAETAKNLREFERDITAADNRQMVRQFRQFEQIGVGVVANSLESFKRRHNCARAGIDEDFVGADVLPHRTVRPADGQRMRAGEARVAIEDGNVIRAAQPFLDAIARFADDLVLARLDRRQIDGDRAADLHTQIGGVARHVSRAGAGHIRLGRRAADIHTGPAEGRAFDDRGFTSALTEPDSKRRTALSRADHDCVEMLWHGKSPEAGVLVVASYPQRPGLP